MVDISNAGERSTLSVIAHELRTPLTSVLGLFALLEDGSVRIDEEEGRELAALGRGEAERMRLIIENLLVASKLAAGGLEPSVGHFSIPDLWREVLGGFPEVERRVFVPLDRKAVALADRSLAAQIVANLIQNVVRYSPDGEVEVRFDHRPGMIQINVADDGPGVPPERAEAIFDHPVSDKGLGVGLGISRQLARAMGGDLALRVPPLRKGATFVLSIPAGDPEVAVVTEDHLERHEAATLTPSSRLLVEMTEVLVDRSVDRLVAGLHKLFSDLLGAEAGYLLVRERGGELKRAGSFGAGDDLEIAGTQVVKEVLTTGEPAFIGDLLATEPGWGIVLGCRSGLFLPVLDDGDPVGVLVVGWGSPVEPSPRLIQVATALARLAAFGVHRAALAADVLFERRLRASVLEAFPIAISVFMGDPPQVVDWNRAEREMLGLHSDDERPANIVLSQQAFDVRFIDGTPLTLDNAPVTQTIRTGKSSGPFLLRVRRADGTEVISRTYCAPFLDENGNVAGAVVSSENMGPGELPI
jgi:PAS domain-containing protein